MKLHPQYITNESGERVSVILSIIEYESLLENIEDLTAVAERHDEISIPHNEMIDGLKHDGLL